MRRPMSASTDLVVETRGLRKVYRDRGRRIVAVDGLDLTVARGGVHGFLGPNGSGKTTTIRMLLGLARPSDGEMRLFGEPVPKRLPDVIDRVGAVVEQPKFTPGFSGHRNLMLLARSIGLSATRVDSAIERVGLADRAKDRYKNYSLGMRQRLAIAATLLKSPELLSPDEPTNGPAPAGIRGSREMVRELGRSGVTVLLSSHILAEVQQVCDSVSIIGDGRLLSTGTVDELVGREGAAGARISVRDPETAASLLIDAGYEVRHAGGSLHVDQVKDPADLTLILADRGLFVRELVPDRPDLEDVFLQLTGEHELGGGS